MFPTASFSSNNYQIQSFMDALNILLSRANGLTTYQPTPEFMAAYRQVLNWNSAALGFVQPVHTPSSIHLDSASSYPVQREKRVCTRFTTEQISILSARFMKKDWVTQEERKELAVATGLREKQVHTWFANKRCKKRQQELKNENN